MKRILLLSALFLVAVAGVNPAHAQQNRRVLIEEFTGAWCGWCPNGELQIQELQAKYPGQVVAVSIHSDQGNPQYDMMDVPQGDTLMAGIPALQSETAVQSFPDGWISRTAFNGTWSTTPQSSSPWIDTTVPGSGLAEQLLGVPASVEAKVDSISFNLATGMVTARITAKFDSSLSGDFRFTLDLIEDSMTGTGNGWDQHNYYYHSSEFVGPYYNLGNPYYIDDNGTTELDGSTIPGWEHMQVFRYSPGPVWGTDGVIPSKVSAGQTYSITYTFPMPNDVVNPNQVKLVGIVSKYSSTILADNQILDADEENLTNSVIVTAPNSVSITSSQSPYLYAHAGGDTSVVLSVQNTGTASVSVGLSVNQGTLPSGWAVTFSPSPITVAAGTTLSDTMTITAPEQSGFIAPTVSINPTEQGVYIQGTTTSFDALSDNTEYPILYDAPDGAAGAEVATIEGMPDSMRLHAAVIPLSANVLLNYPPENYAVSIYDNIGILDNGGYWANPSVLPDIENSLAAGEKVFFSSDDALYWAADPSASSAAYTETAAVQSFYETLGIDFTTTEDRYNTSTGAPIAYLIKGETNDSIGNGISVTNAGGTYILNSVYTIDSNSIPDFYADNKTKNIIGSRYEDPILHGRVVYLGFDLSGITLQNDADTIFNRSINWLLSTEGTAAVNASAPAPVSGITASPNPFHGTTQINYVASQDEQNVTLAAYDVLGREVQVLPTQNAGNNSYNATFDGSILPDGTYVIVVHSSKGTSQVRVVNQQ